MLRSIKENLKPELAIAPVALSATTLQAVGTNMKDKRNFGYLIQVGAFAFDLTNYLTCTIQECDTLGGTYTDSSDVLVLNNQASQESKAHLLSYTGSKQFTKLNVVESGTVAVTFAACGVCTDNMNQPPL